MRGIGGRAWGCPACNGSGGGAGFPEKKNGIWEPPRCAHCDGLGQVWVTISGDAEHYYLSDDGGRILGTYGTLAEAQKALQSAPFRSPSEAG